MTGPAGWPGPRPAGAARRVPRRAAARGGGPAVDGAGPDPVRRGPGARCLGAYGRAGRPDREQLRSG